MGWINGVGNPQVVAEKSQTNESLIDAALPNTHIDHRRLLHTRTKLEDTSVQGEIKFSVKCALENEPVNELFLYFRKWHFVFLDPLYQLCYYPQTGAFLFNKH